MKKIVLLALSLLLMLSLVACGKPGPQGEQGNDGLSAFEIFQKYYPEYTGTEQDWIYAVTTNNVCALFGHKEVTDQAIGATCTENGLTQGSHCEVCNEVFVQQEVVDANHNYVNGVCSQCHRGYVNEAVWNAMLNSENFVNFTFHIYAENLNEAQTEEMLIKVDGDTVSLDGEVTEPEVYLNPLLHIVFASLNNHDNFTYDGTNSVYRSNTQIVYTLSVFGYDVTFTNDNVVVTMDENNRLAKMSCNMKQEFDGCELNVVATFEFTDYGTTQIETNANQ